jgi:hypothetical protein
MRFFPSMNPHHPGLPRVIKESPYMTFRPSRSRVRPSARLFLDALDGRDLPSAPVPGFETTPTATQYTNQTGTDPVVTSFRAVVGANGAVTFSGTVTDDESLAGCIVRITGPGISTTAVILRDGTFNTTVTVFGTSPITVTAEAIDADGNFSDPAYTSFTPLSGPGGGGGGPSSGTTAPLAPTNGTAGAG